MARLGGKEGCQDVSPEGRFPARSMHATRQTLTGIQEPSSLVPRTPGVLFPTFSLLCLRRMGWTPSPFSLRTQPHPLPR